MSSARAQGVLAANKGAKGYEVTPLDSLCGGQVTISIEVMIPMPHVLIMGGGHCGEALSSTRSPRLVLFHRHPSALASAELIPTLLSVSCSVTSFFAEEDAASLLGSPMLLGHDWSEDQERLLCSCIACRREGASQREDGPTSVSLEAVQNGRPSKRHALRRDSPALLDSVNCPIGLTSVPNLPKELQWPLQRKSVAAKGVQPGDAWRQTGKEHLLPEVSQLFDGFQNVIQREVVPFSGILGYQGTTCA